jgi:hypothetical protein
MSMKTGLRRPPQGIFLSVVPKIGPLSGLAFHPPTPAVEQLYMSNFNGTLDHYRALLIAQQEDRPNCPTTTLTRGRHRRSHL